MGDTKLGSARAETGSPTDEVSANASSGSAPTVGASKLGDRLASTVALVGDRFSAGAWLYGMIGVLAIVALLLPPIALPERLGLIGYDTLNAENSSVSHPDGITLNVDPDTFTARLRIQLDSVERDRFMSGEAGASLREAAAALPNYLEGKSTYYQIRSRGKAAEPVMIDVVVPKNVDDWDTLDLYTWTGDSWEWVGGEVHSEVAEHEFVRARVTDIPSSVMIVQAMPITTTVATYVDPTSTAGGLPEFLDEVNPVGLLLGTDGGFVGDNTAFVPSAGGSPAVVPTLRNWAPGASVNRGLLSDVLSIPEIQQAHIENIVQLCVNGGCSGVNVDYRGVDGPSQDAYSGFVSSLATALHERGLRLSVEVPAPTLSAGDWDTGGYDWRSLGSSADAVRVPFPADPEAYGPTGEALDLVDWAKAQVPRYKLHMVVSSLSVENSDAGSSYISMEEALAPFGYVIAMDDAAQISPGDQAEFGFSGLDTIRSIAPVDAVSTYRIEHESEDGQLKTAWLGTPGSLGAKLNWALSYRLGGVVVGDLLSAGNADGVSDAIMGYREGVAFPAGLDTEVVWSVSSPEATVDQQVSTLSEPGYRWTVLVTTGTYTVSARIGGFDHGSLIVDVGSVGSEVEEDGEEVAISPMGGEPVEQEAASECLGATYSADVSIPDNTQLDNGEEFVKTWRVKNSGTCAWPDDTVVAFVSGSQMSAADSVDVGVVESGAETEVSVNMKAPDDPGSYSGVWRMRTADGVFGGNLSVVIRAGDVAAAPPTAVVAPVSGGSFELGGHVRDTGLPYADKMHYSGMTWTKVQVHYGQDASGLVQGAHARGFKIQLSALGSPGMVTEAGFEQDFANWVAGLAAAGADAIEVWNEPNIDREWQIGHISPQAYTNLLCTSYNAIKSANSGTAVISAAPAPTGFFGGCGPNGCDDLPWMQGMYNAGGASCMDYIGAHHNSGATSPSARIGHPANPGDSHHSWFFLPQTELYYNTFGGSRKLFYTEMGYASQEGLSTFSDSFAWARGTNNSQQAAWLAEAVQLSVNTGMVRCIIVWNIDFSRYGYDPQDGYAIVRPGGACPACETLHNVLGS
jgi:spore germination protein YaaH